MDLPSAVRRQPKFHLLKSGSTASGLGKTRPDETLQKEKTMQARLKNPVMLIPGALQALMALDKSTDAADVPYLTRKLVHLRASQINNCAVCVDMHARELKKAGEKDERIFALAAWRETPYFTEAERAALALAEAGTRLADRPDAVPDDVWDEAARHNDEKALAALVVQIALINAFNRLNATTRQMVGTWG
jgi:AhpD family alkylhydroperoxidase